MTTELVVHARIEIEGKAEGMEATVDAAAALMPIWPGASRPCGPRRRPAAEHEANFEGERRRRPACGGRAATGDGRGTVAGCGRCGGRQRTAVAPIASAGLHGRRPTSPEDAGTPRCGEFMATTLVHSPNQRGGRTRSALESELGEEPLVLALRVPLLKQLLDRLARLLPLGLVGDRV